MKAKEFNKLNKEEKKKVPFRKLPTANKLAGIVLIALVVIIPFTCFKSACTNSSPVMVTKAQWDTMSYENKAKWLKSFLNSDGDNVVNAQYQIAQSIKSYFKYPEEVKFEIGSLPRFSNGNIVEADSGFVFFKGFGTAKNAFGVKSRFAYSVMTVIRPDTMYIRNISVNETR